MPALYSRAIMHFMQGLQDVPLGYVDHPVRSRCDPTRDSLGEGTINTWIDDLTFASGGASPNLGLRGGTAS